MSQTCQEGRNRGGSPARRNERTPSGNRGIRRRIHRHTRPAGEPDELRKVSGRRKGPVQNGFVGPQTRDGIRIIGRRGNATVAGALIRYASWLRKNYAFPVRVPVYLLAGDSFVTTEGEIAVSSFFAPFSRSHEPYIRIATGDYPSERKQEGRDNALATYLASLSRQVVHYWQWVETGTVSERGIAREATGLLRRYEKSVDHP